MQLNKKDSSKSFKRVYVAGPYSADNVMDVLRNIRNGIDMSQTIMSMGYSPFCPWLDYHFVLMDFGDSLTLEDFYRYSIDWLEVSDIVYVIGDYSKSKGTLAEIKRAKELGIPIIYDIAEL